jgi:hypothetical protein
VGEEKIMNDFAYPFEWSLYTICRESIQKGRGQSDVFIAGCVCGNGGEGGNVVRVLVVVVDVYIGWVKKKLWMAYPFEWSLYTTCRDSIQKGRGRSDAFIAGCVGGNGGEGGDVVMVKCVNGGKMGVSGGI